METRIEVRSPKAKRNGTKILATLRSTKLYDRRRASLFGRLRKLGFVACDTEAFAHPREWAVAKRFRPIFEKVTIPNDAYAAVARRRRSTYSWSRKERKDADQPVFIHLYEKRRSREVFTLCFDPLTGIIYVICGLVDLKPFPYCVRNVTRQAKDRGLIRFR